MKRQSLNLFFHSGKDTNSTDVQKEPYDHHMLNHVSILETIFLRT
jgi:hypothetical protein